MLMVSISVDKATVLGSGSWGTALANVLAHHAKTVALWGRDQVVCDAINGKNRNVKYLPDIALSTKIKATTNIKPAVAGSQLIVCALPTKSLDEIVSQAATIVPSDIPIVSTSKGICTKTLRLPSHIIKDALKRKTKDAIFVLSGPSFALETARQLPTAVTFAGANAANAEKMSWLFFTPFFRTYPSADVTGVEIAGALKNAIAVAAGISDGLQLGFNTQAALITRGLAEMTRFGVAFGAQPLTFLGLAGVGDLVLTCTGSLSRNRTLGVLLAKGQSLEDALKSIGQSVEGVTTIKSALALSDQKKIDLPIIRELSAILFEKKPAEKALKDLMSRPMRSENPAEA